jgi:hypothetical protein
MRKIGADSGSLWAHRAGARKKPRGVEVTLDTIKRQAGNEQFAKD